MTRKLLSKGNDNLSKLNTISKGFKNLLIKYEIDVDLIMSGKVIIPLLKN